MQKGRIFVILRKNFKMKKDIGKRETSEENKEEGPFGGKCQLAYQHPCQAIQAHRGQVESGHCPQPGSSVAWFLSLGVILLNPPGVRGWAGPALQMRGSEVQGIM